MKRAKAPDLVVGLDVGTTKVCAIITEPGLRGALNVIGVGSAPSRGLRRGATRRRPPSSRSLPDTGARRSATTGDGRASGSAAASVSLTL